MRIRHDPQSQRFIAQSRGRTLGVLDYESLTGGGLDLRRTIVLDNSADDRVAPHLIRWALGYAVANGHGVIASCPVVASRMKRDPMLLGLLSAHARGRARAATADLPRMATRGA